MVQESFSEAPAVVQVSGQPAFADSVKNSWSFFVEGEDGIEMGRFVSRGTGGQQCKVPDADSDIDYGTALGFVLGIASAEGTLVAEGRAVTVVREGALYITCEDAFSFGDVVHIRFDGDPDMGEFLGAIRTATVSMKTVAAGDIGPAVIMNEGDAGDFALVEFDFTGV